MNRIHQTILALGFTAFLAPLASKTAQAEIFNLGSTYTVSGDNFPGSFGPETVTLNGATKPIEGGQLTLSESIFHLSPTSEAIEFNFSTATGGSIAGNINNNFDMAISGVSFTAPATLVNPFLIFSSNGTPFSPITAVAGGFGVEANPINAALGNVFDFPGFAPGAAATSMGLNMFSDPFSFLAEAGIDPASTNGLTFGAVVDFAAVPEPATLALFGAGIAALSLIRRRRAI
jgi:hypothetical protein